MLECIARHVVKEAEWLEGRAWLFAFPGQGRHALRHTTNQATSTLSIFTLSKDISTRQEIFTVWKKYSMQC